MFFFFIFSSIYCGNIGFYNLLHFLNFSELQYLRNKTIGNMIICGKSTSIFLLNYFFCRFVYVISKNNHFYNNIKIISFINFYINFIVYKYTFYNFFLLSILIFNKFYFFGGAYIYNFYFFFVKSLIFSLFLKKNYGNLFFPIYFFNFWYIIFFSRNSKYFVFICKKKKNFYLRNYF